VASGPDRRLAPTVEAARRGQAMRERAVEGVVRAQLPSGLYEVDVDGTRVTAHAGAGTERNFVRLLVGDRVVVELMPRDRTRGRIVRRV
jgi:translation initiation factor IF-1